MNDHQSPDGTKALLAAMSALGLALGVTPAKADPPSNPWGSPNTSDQQRATSQKTDTAWGGDQQKSDQLKSSQLKSNQLKANQIKANQLKSNQLKMNGMEGGEHPQGMEGGETPQPH